MGQGIVVGTDLNQEWLLSWWWKYYAKHNSLPVTFIDFGMSKKSRDWCAKRGQVIPLNVNKDFIVGKSGVDRSLAKNWESWNGENMWEWRAGCFNKPFAMALSPYDQTIWLDLDCELLTSIDVLFDLLDASTEFSVADPEQRNFYNSGVVIYKKNASILKQWCDLCMHQNAQFCTDDFALTHLIQTQKIAFKELPREWNWLMKSGINPFAKIVHWSHEAGKEFIKTHGGMQEVKSRQAKLE